MGKETIKTLSNKKEKQTLGKGVSSQIKRDAAYDKRIISPGNHESPKGAPNNRDPKQASKNKKTNKTKYRSQNGWNWREKQTHPQLSLEVSTLSGQSNGLKKQTGNQSE